VVVPFQFQKTRKYTFSSTGPVPQLCTPLQRAQNRYLIQILSKVTAYFNSAVNYFETDFTYQSLAYEKAKHGSV